jgi:hypothetical protein
LTAASEVDAREHERRLELGSGALVAFPHGLEHCSDDDRPRSGPIRTVALVSRLERIKLPHVAAAAELVSAGRAAGAEVVLEVHGAGHAESEAVALLEAALPASAFTMHGATSEPLAAMRGADVVVGGGRTCLEALSVGRLAVVGRAEPPEGAVVSAPSPGHLGAPVTPATFDAHVADNFSSIGRPPARATDVWRALESLSARDVAWMQDRVRVEHSAKAMLGRELRLLDEISRRPQRPELLLQAAASYAADLESRGVPDAHLRAVPERGKLLEVGSSQARRDRQLDRRLRAARTQLDKAAGSRAWRLSRRGALVLRRLSGDPAALNDGLERARDHIDRVLAGQYEESVQ